MKTRKEKIFFKPLLKRLKGLNLKDASSAELLQLLLAVRKVEKHLNNKDIKPRQMQNAFSCTLFKDNIEKEMQKRKLPDPDNCIYLHREMFEGMVKHLDDEVLTVLSEYFDGKKDTDDCYRILSNMIHTERITNRSFRFNGGCED